MEYKFDAFYNALNHNWFEEDPLLVQLLTSYAPSLTPDERERLSAFGALAGGKLRALSQRSATPENLPYLRHWDGFHNRIDEVVLPESTVENLNISQGQYRLGASHGDPFAFTALTYLFMQNGEAGVGCSMACTDGMVRLLEELGDHPVHQQAISQIRSSSPDRVYHGAQFVTEIQGGSDVPANTLEARPHPDGFTLHGNKWFCSNINADYFLVTGRPTDAPGGGRGVALFLVPAYLDPDQTERNGYTIDRLKEKLGTRELATAEITFDGALGYPVGPLEMGLHNVVERVLVTSRFYCLIVAAAFLRGALRIAESYAAFREAFGSPIKDFPLVEHQLSQIRLTQRRMVAALFELKKMWLSAQQSTQDEEAYLDFRYLLSLCKPVFTRQATESIHDCIMLLGGNGIEEHFSPLPRLWRDSIIMETWEGPHNVLFTQSLKDMMRFQVNPDAFVSRIAGPGKTALAEALARCLAESGGLSNTVPFAHWAPSLVTAFADRVLAEHNL